MLTSREIAKIQSDYDRPLLGKKVPRSAADIFDGTQKPLFTVSGGRVVITILTVEVTTAAIDNASSNMRFVMNPTVGTDKDMCANLDIDQNEVGTIYGCSFNSTVAALGGNGGGCRVPQPRGWVAPEGTIDIYTSVDVGTGGALGSAELFYYPLDEGAIVTAT